MRIICNKIHEAQLFRDGYYQLRLECAEVHGKDEALGVHLDTDNLIVYIVNYFRELSFLIESFGIENNMVSFICL